MLSSYFDAVLSVALAQCSTSGCSSGMPVIIHLAEASPYVQVSRPLLYSRFCCMKDA